MFADLVWFLGIISPRLMEFIKKKKTLGLTLSTGNVKNKLAIYQSLYFLRFYNSHLVSIKIKR